MDKRTCSAEGCDERLSGRLMCKKHYQEWWHSVRDAGQPLPPRGRIPRTEPKVCSVEDCVNTAEKRGWCSAHYSRWRRYGDVCADIPLGQIPPPKRREPNALCSVDGCPNLYVCRGWCQTHYERWRLTGDVQADVPIRVLAPAHAPGDLCSIEDCGEEVAVRGWCDVHYNRWLRHGDPHAVFVLPELRDRMEARIDRSGGPDACHYWLGAQHPSGYGSVYADDKRQRLAHVMAWELENGPNAPGIDLDHECHNQALRDGTCLPGKCPHRLCCNLKHLIPRTKREHRLATPRISCERRGNPGLSKPRRRLSEAEVREIRGLLEGATEKGSAAEVARRYGISPAYARLIRDRKARANLPDVA